MALEKCDLLVIGGGPGGYGAAIRGAQMGLSVILAERDRLGGTCLNRGCLPTKTLIEAGNRISWLGRQTYLRGELKVGRARLLEQMKAIVLGAVGGINATLQKNGVRVLLGQARFIGPKRVLVTPEQGAPREIEAQNIVIASGARERFPAGLEPDGDRVLSTAQALAMEEFPQSVAVLGGGYRGVEFAGIYQSLGARVALLEEGKRLLPGEHRRLTARLKKNLQERGIKVLTRARARRAAAQQGRGVALELETSQGRALLEVDRVLVTGKREPCFEGLDLAAAGLACLEDQSRASADGTSPGEGVFVVGDAAGPPFWAHKALDQGLAAVERITDQARDQAPLWPRCLYGQPEIASLGLTEYEAEKQGRQVRLGEFHFVANGRAATLGESNGMILLVSEAQSQRILGIHIMGPQATEMISLGVMAMRQGLAASEAGRIILPHMTLSESFFEAASAAGPGAIHQFLESGD